MLLTKKIHPKIEAPLELLRNPLLVLLIHNSEIAIKIKHSRKTPSHCKVGTVCLYGRTCGQIYVDLPVEDTTAVRTPDQLRSNTGIKYLVGPRVNAPTIASYTLSDASRSLVRFFWKRQKSQMASMNGPTAYKH